MLLLLENLRMSKGVSRDSGTVCYIWFLSYGPYKILPFKGWTVRDWPSSSVEAWQQNENEKINSHSISNVMKNRRKPGF